MNVMRNPYVNKSTQQTFILYGDIFIRSTVQSFIFQQYFLWKQSVLDRCSLIFIPYSLYQIIYNAL